MSTTEPRPHRHAATPVTAEVYKAANNRINALLRRRQLAGQLLTQVGWGVNPLKELSESLAMLDAALDIARTSGLSRGDPNVTVVVVGDGASPRTGALVAMCTNWSVTSIDPKMVLNGLHPLTNRLACVRAKVEDVPHILGRIVLAPHSHAPVEATRRAASWLGGGHVIAMPCCVAWPKHAGTLTRVSHACTAPDRTMYIERITPESWTIDIEGLGDAASTAA